MFTLKARKTFSKLHWFRGYKYRNEIFSQKRKVIPAAEKTNTWKVPKQGRSEGSRSWGGKKKEKHGNQTSRPTFSCSKRPLRRYKPSSLSFSWMANGMQALGLSKARSHFKNQTRKGNGLTCNRWEALTAPTVCSSHSCTDVGAAKQSAHKVRFQLISRTQWWSPEAQELPSKQTRCPCCAELGEAGSTAWLKSNYAGAVQDLRPRSSWRSSMTAAEHSV